jgi:hypothetical protein
VIDLTPPLIDWIHFDPLIDWIDSTRVEGLTDAGSSRPLFRPIGCEGGIGIAHQK